MATILFDDTALAERVARLADALRGRGWQLVTAESCTGGRIAGVCTDLAGSSDWFDRGLVTYSNAAKTALLGVPAALITEHGAVSEPVVRAMADGALARSDAQIAVAVTGVAGPGGGSADKPVGTVWLSVAAERAATQAWRLQLGGDRHAVRQQTVAHALDQLLNQLADN